MAKKKRKQGFVSEQQRKAVMALLRKGREHPDSKLFQAASKTRKSFQRMSCADEDLGGFCYPASKGLARKLRSLGIDAKEYLGNMHGFVVVGKGKERKIVDITATQFGKYSERLKRRLISERAPFEKRKVLIIRNKDLPHFVDYGGEPLKRKQIKKLFDREEKAWIKRSWVKGKKKPKKPGESAGAKKYG